MSKLSDIDFVRLVKIINDIIPFYFDAKINVDDGFIVVTLEFNDRGRNFEVRFMITKIDYEVYKSDFYKIFAMKVKDMSDELEKVI